MSVTLNPPMDLAIDGSSLATSTSTAGYQKRLLFSATAGQSIGVGLAALTYTPSNASGSTSIWVYKPDGTALATTSTTCNPSNPNGSCSTALAPVNLPTTGTYQLVVSPPAGAAVTGTLTLSNPFYSALTNGSPVAVSITRSGQHAAFNFTGTAGQAVTLRLAVASTTPAGQSVTLALWGPTGQVGSTVSGSPSSDGLTFYSASLPANGTYGVIVVPGYSSTGTMTLTLNPTMDFAIDGTSLAISTSTAGYQKRLLFSATAGQQIGLALTGLTYAPSSGVNASMYVYNPSGGLIAATSCNPGNPGGGCSSGILNLPTAGTYQVVVAPPSNVTFSGTLTVSNPIYGSLTAGTPLALNVARAGQFPNISFSGNAGQSVTLRLAMASTTPTDQPATLMLWGPTGQVGSTVNGTPSSDGTMYYAASLPATGGYSVTAVPSYGATASMTLTLNPAMDLAIDGTSLAISTSTAGYQKRVMFSATAGQQIGLALTGLTYTPSSGSSTTMYLYNPSGGLSAVVSCNPSNPGGNCSTGILNLPTAGTYQILVVPPSNVTFSGTLTASNPIYGSITAGTPLTLNMTRAGQFSNNGFSGTAGQSVMLRLATPSTTPTNQPVTLSLWGPTGQVGSSVTGSPSTDGMTLYAASLPATGSYAVTAVPSYGATGSMTLTLNPSADLAVDAAPVAVSSPAAGYAKRYLISVAAGDVIDIGISSIVHTPASGSYTTLSVLAPNGTTAVSSSCGTAGLARCDASFLASTAGLYTILLTPPSAVSFSGNMTISHRLTGSLTIGGGAIAVGLHRDGQKATLTFSGTSGQLLRLSVSGMSTNPSGQAVYFYVERSDFSLITWTSTTAATLSLDIPALDTTGTFYVVVVPVTAVQADMNVSLGTR